MIEIRGRASRGRRWLTAAAALLTLAVVPSFAIGQPAAEASQGEGRQAPPEWGPDAASWAGPNYDLANTRATTRTPINARNVSKLKVKWRLPLENRGFFGNFASNPIAVNGTVYVIDLNSHVYAVDQETGRVKWERTFDSTTIGPNGVAYGWGLLFGTTATGVFALDPRTGATIWTRELISNGQGALDISPQLYGNTVIVSTVPSTLEDYKPGVAGIVWALEARTGTPQWNFNTVKDGDLWGHPELNSGGGLWYPPAVDEKGRVFITVGNPAPFPGTPEFPSGTSRPGPNLYTNSIVALDGKTGKLLWYQQAAPHDLRDYDLHVSPIVTYVRIRGVKTEIVIAAGKMGKVFAYRADDGRPIWTISVGKHENDTGPLPDVPTLVFPGLFGGVETPMAVADNRLFVPWVDAGFNVTPTSYDMPDLTQGKGGLLATDVATGRVLWKRDMPQMNFGAATVANDVVFSSSYDGKMYAFDTRTGRTLWTDQARAGINSQPAIAGDTVIVGAAAPALFQNPIPEIIAYSLD
ncbi:MAG: Cytochrome c class [Sphaerisporangium sp.]|nr:Cytochrome c class [Sphaerisporangium sp.]